MLLEKPYGIDKKGEAKEGKSSHINPSKYSVFFNMYARAHRTEYVIKKDSGWTNLNLALEIRNRLMHPKRVDDPLVSDEEIKILADASIWSGQHIVALLKCCNMSLAEKIQDFESQLNEIERLHQRVV